MVYLNGPWILELNVIHLMLHITILQFFPAADTASTKELKHFLRSTTDQCLVINAKETNVKLFGYNFNYNVIKS